MKCPVCKDVSLVMSERQGIEIDYCPSCRGVWLDRGELDKIIDKSTNNNSHNHSQPQYNNQPQYSQPKEYFGSHKPHKEEYNHYNGHYKKKKEGFLSDLFDFD